MNRLAASMLGMLSLALAACGGTHTVTVTTPASAAAPTSSATTATSTSSPAPAATSTAPSPSPAGGQAIVHLASFRSPSGNIGCIISSGLARCDIRDRHWRPPARPAGCPSEVDFGQGLEVADSGPGRVVCAGDTALDPGAEVLPYGTDSVEDQFTCQSRTAGLTCVHDGTRHGFFISAQSYRAF